MKYRYFGDDTMRLFNVRNGFAIDVYVGGTDEDGGCYPSAQMVHDKQPYYLRNSRWFNNESEMWLNIGMEMQEEGFVVNRPFLFKGMS